MASVICSVVAVRRSTPSVGSSRIGLRPFLETVPEAPMGDVRDFEPTSFGDQAQPGDPCIIVNDPGIGERAIERLEVDESRAIPPSDDFFRYLVPTGSDPCSDPGDRQVGTRRPQEQQSEVI